MTGYKFEYNRSDRFLSNHIDVMWSGFGQLEMVTSSTQEHEKNCRCKIQTTKY